jgi:hypothetical protein
VASEPEFPAQEDVQPPVRRSAARHAVPRLTVRGRIQLPVGRVLALTAVPTALLMGSLAPKFAFAADTKAAPVSSPTQVAPITPVKGADCTASSTPTKTATTAAHKAAAPAKQHTTTTVKSGSATAPTPKTPARTTAPAAPVNRAPAAAAPTAAPTTAPTSAAPQPRTAHSDPLAPVTGLLNGIVGLLGGHTPTQSAAPGPAAPAAPAPAASHAAPQPAGTSAPDPTQTGAPGTPTVPATPPTATTPTGGATTPAPPVATTPAAPSAKALANRMCNARLLAAPLDTSFSPSNLPADPWTLKTSRLELINTEFHGVVTVHTAAGDVRVLKFTAEQVNIDNLDMSAPQDGRRLHVQGGPGTTSTMRHSTVTMYVTSLSGTLSKAEGIPLAWLNVNLTLTPDSLPQWLYDLIGAVPIPLTLELTNATAIQAGQVGGDLTIPGMHLYYTPLN